MAAKSLADLVREHTDLPDIRIVDVGANPLTGQPAPYQPLLDGGIASLVGFEPDAEAFAKLQAIATPRETYLQQAVGDGRTHTLHVCAMSGMSSLLRPEAAMLDLLHYHSLWGRVTRTMDVETVRLDDLAATTGLDYLKIDIQGGELMVFQNARERLQDCLVVHTEAMFVPMYEQQPLFSDQELELRAHGLRVHKFVEVAGHVLKPLTVNGDAHAPLSQIFWADVLFIKDITRPDRLTPQQLLKLAVILHDVYRSVDVAHLFLKAYDERQGTGLAPAYLGLIMGPQPAS